MHEIYKIKPLIRIFLEICNFEIYGAQDSTKLTIFWNVTPCSLINRNQHLGGTCCPLQGHRLSLARS
jgi:hypothetical protein